MKTLKSFTAIIILGSVVLLSACTDKSNLLVKTWQLNNLSYAHEIPAEMLPQIERTVAEMKQSFTLVYHADKTYQTTVSGLVTNGTWQLNWNSSSLTATTSTGEHKKYKIIELTDSKFIFTADEGGQEVTFELIPKK